MGKRSITQLYPLSGDLAPDDLFVVDDISAGRTFKVRADQVAINGGVFITDITPQNNGDNVYRKIYDDANVSLVSCASDTQDVIIHYLALTGHTNYKPFLKLLELPNYTLNLSNTQDQGVFTGTKAISLQGKETLTVRHEDGAYDRTSVEITEAPQILSAEFTSQYPGSQTEVKENDTMRLTITADVEFNKIEVANYEACKAKIETFTNTNTKEIEVQIANRGNTATLRPARVRIFTPDGAVSTWTNSTLTGNIELTNTVKCNNQHPVISFGNIEYPTGQEALKENEQAAVNHTVNHFSSITYSSPNGEIYIYGDINSYETPKTVARDAGGYNITQNNFTIQAHRVENDSSSSNSTVIKIAHDFQIINVNEAKSRLRHGDNTRVDIISDQYLIEPPTLDIPVGSWTSNVWNNGPTTWRNYMSIGDDVPNDIYHYVTIYTKNLAGRIVQNITGDDTYEVGGFTTRRIFFGSFQHTSPIGTYVSNTNKLECIDIGGYDMLYVNSLTPQSLSYTIVDSNGSLDQTGNYIRILDQDWVDQNSSGTAFVDLEELV